METLNFDNCRISVYLSTNPQAPVVYIPVYTGVGEDIYTELNKKPHAMLNLVVISNINWALDMAPFCMKALNANSSACLGGALDFLKSLTKTIIPTIEINFKLTPLYRVLCGYSLAGLFSLYALHYTTLFTRIGSFSGSLWLPQFKDYLKGTELKIRPERIYLSLGNQEKNALTPYLRRLRTKPLKP